MNTATSLVMLLAISLAIYPMIVNAQNPTILYVDPTTTEVQVSRNFEIYIKAREIPPDPLALYAFQFDLLYNPAAVECVSLTEGLDVTLHPPYMIVILTFDNNLGIIRVAITLMTPAAPLGPQAELIHAVFHCKGNVDTGLQLTNVFLMDTFANLMPFLIEDGQVDQRLPIGGKWAPPGNFQLSTPLIALLSFVAASATSLVCVKRYRKGQR